MIKLKLMIILSHIVTLAFSASSEDRDFEFIIDNHVVQNNDMPTSDGEETMLINESIYPEKRQCSAGIITNCIQGSLVTPWSRDERGISVNIRIRNNCYNIPWQGCGCVRNKALSSCTSLDMGFYVRVSWGDRTVTQFPNVIEQLPMSGSAFHKYQNSGRYTVCISVRQRDTPTGTRVCQIVNVPLRFPG